MRSVMFDLDGTLADTSADLIAAANLCFSDLGLGPLLHPEEDAAIAVRGARAMLNEGFSRVEGEFDGETDRLYPRLLDYYGSNIAVHTELYPGTREVLAALRAEGYRVGVCTNKPEGLAEKLLRALDVRDAFHSLIGADTLPVRKPDPAPLREAVVRAGADPARTVLVGDTETDRDTARAMGVPSVLVAFGPGGETVRAMGADHVLDHFDDLPGLMAQLDR